VVAGLCERWEVEVARPYQPGGTASWVAPTTDGRVLKVGWAHYEARDEAAGLRVWDGQGAVRVYRAERFGPTDALLLEACRPGTTLTASLPPVERDEVVAKLLPRLWMTPPPGSGFRPLQSMTEAPSGVPSELPHASTFPFRNSTSPIESMPCDGSTIRPPLSRRSRVCVLIMELPLSRR
jgi:hypothetical protein